MDRITYYNESFGSFIFNPGYEDIIYHPFELVNYIGQLEDRIARLEACLNGAD